MTTMTPASAPRWPSERKRPCPDCGAPMAHTSKRCRLCARNRAGRATFPKAGPKAPEAPCTCQSQRPERGVWHDASCARHAHRYVLPPQAGLDDQTYAMRCECGHERMYRPEDGSMKAQQHRRLQGYKTRGERLP